MEDKTAAQQIDAIIQKPGDWRGDMLSQLRAVVKGADQDIVEEVKWKKPSKPEGIPVWSYNGILCVADTLKNAVRLTFPNGAQLSDPAKLFNTRLDSKTVRAIDVFEGAIIDHAALQALIRGAIALNAPKPPKK